MLALALALIVVSFTIFLNWISMAIIDSSWNCIFCRVMSLVDQKKCTKRWRTQIISAMTLPVFAWKPHQELGSGLQLGLQILVVQLIWRLLISPTSEVQGRLTKEEEKPRHTPRFILKICSETELEVTVLRGLLGLLGLRATGTF
jgi:hypothetical protein